MDFEVKPKETIDNEKNNELNNLLKQIEENR